MAFTDIEVKEARAAVIAKAEAADLFRLGLIYSTDHEDRGPDMIEAHKWFNLAALLGSRPAQAYRSELTLEMSNEDVTLAQRAARGWLAENRTKMAAVQAV
ncbi:MAG: hypothetical protein JKY25_11255 [Robiginitomaculum sp.]|nr:hypothetical protein [Robiginitomaculum sp.]